MSIRKGKEIEEMHKGVREDPEKKEDTNALSVNNMSYKVSFYRFPQSVISAPGCTVGTSPVWMWLPQVNGNSDIFRGLAIKA